MSVHISNVKIDELEESRPISSPRSNDSIISQQSYYSHQTYRCNTLFLIQNDNIRKSHSVQHKKMSYLLLKTLNQNDSINSQLTNPVDIQNNLSGFPIKDIIVTNPPKENPKRFNSNWLYFQQSQNENTVKSNAIQVPKKSNMKAHYIDSKGNSKNNNNNTNHNKQSSTYSTDTVFRKHENLSVLQECGLANITKKKEIEISIDYSQQIVQIQFDKIKQLFNSNTLFNLIQFFNGEDLGYLFNTCKQMRAFLKYSIETVYLQKILQQIKKSNAFFDILSAKLHYSKLRQKSIKIDYVTTIRFKNIFNSYIPYQNKATNIGISFIYKHFSSQSARFIDYYSLDLIPFDGVVPSIFMTREFTTFTLDHLQKTYIQPILPFKTDDQGLLNIKIYTPENGFVNPNSLLFKFKVNYINNEDKSNETNPRVCEYEVVCFHWKILSYLPQQNAVMNQLRGIFEPKFKIIRVQYEDIGYLIFKVMLKAVKEGLIENKEELGISIRIKERKDTIMNEIKKNDLLFERRNEFELRIGDVILFYLTNNNSKSI